MPTFVHYLPIATTLLAIPFTYILYRHWQSKPEAPYLFWWMLGVGMYGVGTFTESLTTLWGWHPAVFKAWYISGALLGGAPLAQGTVYLLLKRKTAHVLSGILVTLIVVAAACVLLSPLTLDLVENHRLSGEILTWQWVRAFSPFINIYAFIFLVGGAAWSAWRYAKASGSSGRMWGNISIAVGALLPGIGGTSARMGHVEVLYITELMGLVFIWIGYSLIKSDGKRSIHKNQRSVAASAA